MTDQDNSIHTLETDLQELQELQELQPRPDASSQIARVVHTITESRDDVAVQGVGPHGALLQLGDKESVILMLWEEASAEAIGARLKQLMKQPAQGRLVVGLIGGSDSARRILKRAKPMITQVKVGQVHIDDQGDVWTRNAPRMKKALARLSVTQAPSDSTWAELLEQSAANSATLDEKAIEAHNFSTLIAARKPVATLTLGATILAVFGLEALFGGTQSATVLLRMGALDPERVLAGEVWRLFSCTFLHAGFLHVLFNTYVLWVLGSFLERILGTWRFLLVYGLSCLGASLASLVFLEGFSVGASGGVWGLLGAQAVLAWRSRGLLPRAMIGGARRAAKFNLGLNVVNSFRPHVDMWAHFGGGAVGAALLFFGLVTRNLPRLGELESQESLDSPEAMTIPTTPQLKLAGGAITLVLYLGLALALATGRPWKLQQPIELVRTPIPDLGISLTLPPRLPQTLSQAGDHSVEVGNFIVDLGSVVLTHYPGNYTDAADLESGLVALLEALKEAPTGGRLIADPREVSLAGSRGVIVRYAYENEVEEEIAFVFLEDAIVKANTVRWPEFRKAIPEDYVVSILDSLERIPPAG